MCLHPEAIALVRIEWLLTKVLFHAQYFVSCSIGSFELKRPKNIRNSKGEQIKLLSEFLKFIWLSVCSVLQVKAYYSVLSSLPCPALDELCNEVDCTPQVTFSPLKGLLPSPGWCLRQWQKTIPKNYTSKIKLGWELTDSVKTNEPWAEWNLMLCSFPYSSGQLKMCHCTQELIYLSDQTQTSSTVLHTLPCCLLSGRALKNTLSLPYIHTQIDTWRTLDLFVSGYVQVVVR